MSARDFAIQAHGDQMYGDKPYVEHLDAVAAIVRSWGLAGAPLDAAYLHDVLEDTSVTKAQMAATFGERTTEIVWCVTAEGDERADKMGAIYAKVAGNGSAAVVKLADRIANLEAVEPGDKHSRRYLGEDEAFRAAIRPYVPLHFWDRYERATNRARGS